MECGVHNMEGKNNKPGTMARFGIQFTE